MLTHIGRDVYGCLKSLRLLLLAGINRRDVICSACPNPGLSKDALGGNYCQRQLILYELSIHVLRKLKFAYNWHFVHLISGSKFLILLNIHTEYLAKVSDMAVISILICYYKKVKFSYLAG